MKKQDELTFDASGPLSHEDGLFGLPDFYEESKIIFLPVPWEVTTSYGSGASLGPQAIREASDQIDLFSVEFGHPYRCGYHMMDAPDNLSSLNDEYKAKAQKVMDELIKTTPDQTLIDSLTNEVNAGSEELNSWVYENSRTIIEHDKIPALIGGDHSTPYGLIKALTEKRERFSILHIDAHFDLRVAYQGFQHSHASIMYNALQLPNPPKLVTLGLRDFCEEELELAKEHKDIDYFLDADLAERKFQGESWKEICESIVGHLEQDVYISCDIDGFQPDLCPNTGTPVPGGLSYNEFSHLMKTLVHSDRRIIGFDLVEVAPDPEGKNDWDGNVGARILYQLAGWTALSNGLC